MLKRQGILMLCSMALVGCIATGTKVDESRLTGFQRGTTTYPEVVRALGTPNQSVIRDDGSRQVMYVYTQSQVNPANFVPIVGAFLGGSTMEQTTTTFEFDGQAVLVSYSSVQSQTAVGTGLTSGAKQ